MTRYLLRRLLWSAITLVLFATLMFFLVQIIIPEDFTVQFAMQMNRAERAALKAELGLDRPLWEQYLRWMGDFFTGKLGTSFYGYPVLETFKIAIPLSLLIFLPGTALAFLIGLTLGRFTAWRAPGILTGTTTFAGMAFYTSFPPWLAWLIAYFLARRLRFFRVVFRADGFSGLDSRIWGDMTLNPSTVATYMLLTVLAGISIWMVLNTLLKQAAGRRIPMLLGLALACAPAAWSWQALGFGAQAADVLKRAALPLLTYTLLSFGETMLIMRTSMTDTLQEEYVNVARAKGLPERVVRDKHAARNAILPVVSRLVITLPYLMTGVVIIEDVLEWPGLGTTLWSALYQQDMPVVMAMFLMIGAFSLIARLFLDLLTAVLDPRLRHEEAEVQAAQS